MFWLYVMSDSLKLTSSWPTNIQLNCGWRISNLHPTRTATAGPVNVVGGRKHSNLWFVSVFFGETYAYSEPVRRFVPFRIPLPAFVRGCLLSMVVERFSVDAMAI